MSLDLRTLASKAAELYERALAGPMTARDVAMAVEYNQQYFELLEKLERTAKPVSPAVVAKENGQAVKFSSVDGLADWIVEHME